MVRCASRFSISNTRRELSRFLSLVWYSTTICSLCQYLILAPTFTNDRVILYWQASACYYSHLHRSVRLTFGCKLNLHTTKRHRGTQDTDGSALGWETRRPVFCIQCHCRLLWHALKSGVRVRRHAAIMSLLSGRCGACQLHRQPPTPLSAL